MSISVNPVGAYCKKQNCYVSLEQTEGHCRDNHQCADDACPLEAEFGHNRFSRAINSLAQDIGHGFASKLGK